MQAPLAEGISDNRAYIRQFCANLSVAPRDAMHALVTDTFPCRRLKNAFPHVETAYLEAFVNGLAQDAQDLTAYRNRIRDLLVVSKELSAGEGAAEELFAAEDQEEKRRAAAAADERRAAAVPGMLKPSMVKVSCERHELHCRADC